MKVYKAIDMLQSFALDYSNLNTKENTFHNPSLQSYAHD